MFVTSIASPLLTRVRDYICKCKLRRDIFIQSGTATISIFFKLYPHLNGRATPHQIFECGPANYVLFLAYNIIYKTINELFH